MKTQIKKVSLATLLSCVAFSVPLFAWSISGQVVTNVGTGISEVAVSSFNFAGYETKTDNNGFFRLSNDGSLISDFSFKKDFEIGLNGSVLEILNNGASLVKVSVMDMLGKVLVQKSFDVGTTSFDLQKYVGQNAFVLKVTSSKVNENYVVRQGVLHKTLKSVAATSNLATLFFVKEGYEQVIYSMQNPEETNVKITMYEAGTSPVNSSASAQPVSSSSAQVTLVSSSSFAADVKPSTVLVPGKYNRTVNGRSYILYVPSTYDGSKAVPLLVDYHPIGGSASNWSASATYEAETKNESVIIIYPDGAQSPSMGQAWNVGPCCTDADDITFSREFIEATKKEVYIDSKRIYASGFSMGGGMSNYVACFMADVYAAVAPASFDLAKEIVDAGKCKPSRPIPILNFRGTGDFVVSYNGGLSSVVSGKPITFMGAKNNLQEWAKMNGCSGSPQNDANGCEMYENCSAGVKVGLCTDKLGSSCSGSGHEAVCSRIAWSFLKQFKMP